MSPVRMSHCSVCRTTAARRTIPVHASRLPRADRARSPRARARAGLDVRGGDVVEECPALDHADITSHLAAHILWEMLALVALRNG